MITRSKLLTFLLSAFAALPLLANNNAPQDFSKAVPFELGDTEFLPGDSITIQEVRGTSDVIQPGETYCVTGTYTLASRDEADLAFFVTTTNRVSTPVDAAQHVRVSKGTGSFRLIQKLDQHGYLHVSFYSPSHGFGGVYFGQGKWVLHNKHFRYSDASGHSAAAASEPVSDAGPNKALFHYIGNPVAAPASMNAAYTKEGLTQAMQTYAQKAGISLVKLEIDDSEFPFLVGVTFAKATDKEKLIQQIRASSEYAASGGVGGEINYAMNIVPHRAFPQDVSQRIYRRMLLREAILYDKLTGVR